MIDEKVAASSSDLYPGYLDEKVDNVTIEVEDDKLQVKPGGHTHTISEITDYSPEYKVKINSEDGNPGYLFDKLNSDSFVILGNKLSIRIDGHYHTSSGIYGFDNSVINNTEVATNTANRHSHTNKLLLDNLVDSGDGSLYLSDDGTYKLPDIEDNDLFNELVEDSHEHSNKSALDNIRDDGDRSSYLNAQGNYINITPENDKVRITESDSSAGYLINKLSSNDFYIMTNVPVTIQNNNPASHKHNDRYYTESEVDDGFQSITYRSTSDPTVNNDSSDGRYIGDFWLNTDADKLFICADNSVSAAVWLDILDIDNWHTHENKPVLDIITNTGSDSEFLNASGYYSEITLPASFETHDHDGVNSETVSYDDLTDTPALDDLYLRLDGTNEMEGSLNMAANDIVFGDNEAKISVDASGVFQFIFIED